MIYVIGQVCGVLSTIACMAVPMFKTKSHMLMDATAVNFFLFLNYILIGQGGAAVFVCGVATAQSICSLIHTIHGKNPSKAEKGAFLLLYLSFGIYGMLYTLNFAPGWNGATFVELLPICGSLLNMCFVYITDERRARWFLLVTVGVWATYSAIIGATAFFGQFFTVLTTLMAMYRYRKQPEQTPAAQP